MFSNDLLDDFFKTSGSFFTHITHFSKQNDSIVPSFLHKKRIFIAYNKEYTIPP